MTPLQMQAYFELEIAKIDELEKPQSEDIFYFINQAARKFVKTRYSGVNPKSEGFEQTQKRMDDLRTLVKEARLVPYTPVISGMGAKPYAKPHSCYVVLPDNYFVTLGEEVDISFTSMCGGTKTERVGITECTVDTYTMKVADPNEMHRLHMDNAWPLRLYLEGDIWLITDGNYTIPYYYLTYLAFPGTIYVGSTVDLPIHTHEEVVKIAVDMYLENISDQRVKTYPTQVGTME